MIKRDMLQRLLKRAAEEESEVPKQTQPAPQKAVYQKRYYLYTAPVSGSIPFGRINEVLTQGQDSEKEDLANKLRGGSSKYQADYFHWEKMYLVTDYYDPTRKNLIVYEATLNSDGSKQDMVSRVYPNDASVTPETVENDFILFSTANQNSAVINFDNVVDNMFINVSGSDVSNAVQTLSRREDLPNSQNMSAFKSLFNEYRLWSRMESRLLYPDLSDPQNTKQDGVPGRYYPGGEAAFAYIMKETGNLNLYQPTKVVPGPGQEGAQPNQDQQDQKQPEPQKQEQKEPNSPKYTPAGPTAPVKGDVIDKDERFMMANSVNLKKMARNVTLNFLRDAAYSTYNSVGTSDNDDNLTSDKVQKKIKYNEEENKVLKETEQELKKLENQQKQLK